MDTWYDQEVSQGIMILDSDGTYSWEAYDSSVVSTGTWDASAEYLRSVTTSFNDQEGYFGYLNPYDMPDADTLILDVEDGGTQTYKTTSPPM